VSRLRPTTIVLGAILLGALYLLRLSYWPSGSVNMLVATDGTRIRRLQVEDADDRVLWHISSSTGRLAGDLGVLRYGVVPSGFTQEVPPRGDPRSFKTDEVLSIYVFTERNSLGASGRARGPDTFLQVVWFSGPLPAEAIPGSIGATLRPRSGASRGSGK
jgi:hypothetical protein